MKKILGVILGILMCIGGFYCIFTPVLTFSSLTIVFGIVLIERAIALFVIWFKLRKVGGANILMLINAILSVIGGIALLTDMFTQIIMESMMLTMISIFMIASGIIEIVDAFQIKKTKEGSSWVLNLICGILVVIGGIFSFANPLALSITLGVMLAIDIIVFGVTLIIRALSC